MLGASIKLRPALIISIFYIILIMADTSSGSSADTSSESSDGETDDQGVQDISLVLTIVSDDSTTKFIQFPNTLCHLWFNVWI